jgi:hypothetical protein
MEDLERFIYEGIPVPKNAHIPTKDYFTSRGYKEIVPYQDEGWSRSTVWLFYISDKTFGLRGGADLIKLQTVYKINKNFEVQFAASFFVVELDSQLVVYLKLIKAKERKQGYGSEFIAHLCNFLEQELQANKNIQCAHFLLLQSMHLKPHEFFRKQGFGLPPEQFNYDSLFEIAYKEIRLAQCNQQEYLDIDNVKPDVSVLVNTSPKLANPKKEKHSCKRCPLCKGKFICDKNANNHTYGVPCRRSGRIYRQSLFKKLH